MTATVTDIGTWPTVEQRRRGLINLAERCKQEEHRADQEDWPMVAMWVPIAAAAVVPNPLDIFTQLVGAAAEFQAFVNNEDEWLLAHDYPLSVSREDMHTRLQGDVDWHADRLMGRAS